MKPRIALGIALLLALFGARAAPLVDALRGPVPILGTTEPARLGNPINDDSRLKRNYGQQPPVIPHRIDGYQVDRSANRCVGCHSRTRIEETRAIPIPATHYMDRDGTMRGDVSPRRYFCTQCHVPQHETKAPITNDFVDVDTLLNRANPGGRR